MGTDGKIANKNSKTASINTFKEWKKNHAIRIKEKDNIVSSNREHWQRDNIT